MLNVALVVHSAICTQAATISSEATCVFSAGDILLGSAESGSAHISGNVYPFGTSALTRGSASAKGAQISCHSPQARLRHLREPGIQNGITKDGLGSGSFNSMLFFFTCLKRHSKNQMC